MKLNGRSTINEFLGDQIAFRNLVPLDARLPTLDDLRETVGLSTGVAPRKTSPEYARVITHILRAAHQLSVSGATIQRLLFIGDTRLNDATAFVNICRAGGWPGAAFICAEKLAQPAKVDLDERGEHVVYHANRWGALPDFEKFCQSRDLSVDENTAVILDLDKTCLGARGRNDGVINRARVEAAFATVESLMGNNFNAEAFEQSYDLFNEPDFHPFTTDNQDYLVYICLIVSTGLYSLSGLAGQIRSDVWSDFEHFCVAVDAQADKLPAGVRAIHADVHARVQQGDPTPFKAFRANEYLATIAHMGQLDDDTPLETRLTQEIVITQEVRERASNWLSRGALLFGLSDKPDEASIPSDELAGRGYLPIHRVETHVVGGENE